MIRTVAAVAGVALAVEVARRGLKRSSAVKVTPAQVSQHAAAELAGIETGLSRRPRDYTEAYIEQKRGLIAKFDGATEYYCSSNLFGVCLPIPPKVIPTASRDVTRQVVNEWIRVAASVRNSDAYGELEDLLGVHIVGLSSKLSAHTAAGGIGSGSSPLEADTNRRVWSHIGQIALALQGVMIHHGDITIAARKELIDTVTDPAKYVEAAGDGASAATSFLAQALGSAAGKFVASNVGAVVLVGGVAYFVLRRSL